METINFWFNFIKPINDNIFPNQNKKIFSILEILDLLQLKNIINIPTNYLSSGQQHKLLLARLLLVYRPIWVMDEPETHLDHNSKKKLQYIMNLHIKYGGIIITATHKSFSIKNRYTIILKDINLNE